MISIFASTGAFRSRHLATILQEAPATGVDGIELSTGLDTSQDMFSLVRCAPRSMRYLVHNYFPPEETGLVINLGSVNDEIRHQSLLFCKRGIDFAAKVGAGMYSVHSAFCVDPHPSFLGRPQLHLRRADPDLVKQLFFTSLDELSWYARRRNVTLCIENNVCEVSNMVDECNVLDLMTHPREIEEFVSEKCFERIQLLIDVGHVKVSAQAEKFEPGELIEIACPRIAALHLSDNDGVTDENKPYGSNAWFWPHVVQLPALMAAVIEVYNLETTAIATLSKVTKEAFTAHR